MVTTARPVLAPIADNSHIVRLFVILLFILPQPATATVVETRISVDPAQANTVTFDPVETRFVRFAIHKSHGSQPCIDELEVYGPSDEKDGGKNLALASAGAIPTASSSLPGYATHRIEFLNDGKYGNDKSWICAEQSGWAQVELPNIATVDRIVFSRDRAGKYADRIPAEFEIQVSADGQEWLTVKRIVNAGVVVPEAKLLLPNRPISLDFPAQDAKYVRLVISKSISGQPCVDELEVFGPGAKENIGLASAGAVASASSCLEGHEIHKIEHLNDGRYTNQHSWIAAEATGWAQIELAKPAKIDRVVFSRDRDGGYRDRMARQVELMVSLDGRNWNRVKKVFALEGVRAEERIDGESPQDWAYRVSAGLSGKLRETAQRLARDVKSAEDVQALIGLHGLEQNRQAMLKRLPLEFNPAAIRRAVDDLSSSYPDRYPVGVNTSAKLDSFEDRLAEVTAMLANGDGDEINGAIKAAEEMIAFGRSVLLANPLLDFGEILILKRKTPEKDLEHTYWQWGQKYGMTVNWSCDFRPKNPPVADWWDESLVAMPWADDKAQVRTIFKAASRQMIQHPELHFDAQRMLFAMPGPGGAFQVFEVNVDGSGLRQITTDTGPDIDNGDPCYLPDERIIFNSTRMFTGVPCEDGESYVSNLCITDSDGRNTRMLTFDQESNWYPTLLNNGRVLYTRYEYANVSHQFGRLLFHMNPDGSGQMEFYGSNSYWPNSIFYARPIPNHPTMVVGVVCGHHGPNRTGRLVLFDSARGRRETEGAVQTIPGHGKPVERIVEDALYGNVWPKFVHPWPLSDKYYLVSARMHSEQTEYGVYLVDVFDNMTELCRLPDYSLLEPIPLAARNRPPEIPDRVKPDEKQATVYLANVYEGRGLEGVPQGKVKRLRLFTYNYLYRHTLKRGFGHLATPGVDGPWEPRYILGTVPVNEDGSALFKVPANTPISVQPLDEQGRALQLMRSWFTAMPGEVLSCVGCHEKQNSSPVPYMSAAALAKPAQIEPWRGPPRGFDFELEVQPVLDEYCAGCHDGSKPAMPNFARMSDEEKALVNREYHRATESVIVTEFTPSFIALHPYVRRPHAESNYGIQVAAEYFSDTSPLVQMLEKGHHNVTLDDEAWDRFYTWIDLGAPDQGSWKYSEWGVQANYYERRLEMLERFARRTDDVEWLPEAPEKIAQFVRPPAESDRPVRVDCPQWPFDEAEAKRRAKAVEMPQTLTIEIADGLAIEFVLIPPGEFVMGDPAGAPDERHATRVGIERPFYMARHEVTNAQFAAVLDKDHFSGHVGWRSIDWRGEGYPLFEADQPAVRVSWHAAMAFCEAISKKTGSPVSLPTESQWEWACRAGSDSPLWYGNADDDFGPLENLAGREQRGFAFRAKRKWYLRDERSDDGAMITARAGSYAANPWGLHDMAGNVSEWTRSAYRPYPYDPADGRDAATPSGEKVVRGGSWHVRPTEAGSAHRWKYPAWRKVFNVGFRPIIEP